MYVCVRALLNHPFSSNYKIKFWRIIFNFEIINETNIKFYIFKTLLNTIYFHKIWNFESYKFGQPNELLLNIATNNEFYPLTFVFNLFPIIVCYHMLFHILLFPNFIFQSYHRGVKKRNQPIQQIKWQHNSTWWNLNSTTNNFDINQQFNFFNNSIFQQNIFSTKHKIFIINNQTKLHEIYRNLHEI